jgi:hypothetical protein
MILVVRLAQDTDNTYIDFMINRLVMVPLTFMGRPQAVCLLVMVSLTFMGIPQSVCLLVMVPLTPMGIPV